MLKKNGQFSVEFLLIFVFMMSIVSVLIVILGNISIEVSLDEKRSEVDDFAGSILKEFEIMQTVEGGYYRNFDVPVHFMDRFNIKIDGDYLIVSDLFSYSSETDFIRYYKIPGDHITDTNYDSFGNLIITLCKNFNEDLNSVDFFNVDGINDDYCFDKLVNNYINFSTDSSDLTFVGNLTSVNLNLQSISGSNIIYLRDYVSGVLLEYDFDVFSAPTSKLFESNLTSSRVLVSFKNSTNINTFELNGNGIVGANFPLIYS
jgi:hypothetical protein